MECPDCGSAEFWRNGFNKKIKRQMYKCKICGKVFHSGTQSRFLKMRHPPEIIDYAVDLYFSTHLSLRGIAGILEERGIKVSHVSIYKWTKKFKTSQYENPGLEQIRTPSCSGGEVLL